MTKGKASAGTYLIEVAPFTRSGHQSSLSYFSPLRLSPGTIVKAPLGNRSVRAVVLNSKSVLSEKSGIRRAGFMLKKIGSKDVSTAGFSPRFLAAVSRTALYYALSPGALLETLLPKMLLSEPELFFQPPGKTRKTGEAAAKETILLQMESDERFSQYRAMVRQSFARKASVMFVAPTHLDALKAGNQLRQGIADYVYVFTLREKGAEARKIWQKALRDKHPVLFITTPAGLSFERRDLATYIIERENSRAWRTLARPYIHFRVFLENLSKETGRQLVLGDSVLSLETLRDWKEMGSDHGELSLVRWRLPAAPTRLVDASAKPDQGGKFEIFSSELKNLVAKALVEKEPIFLLGVRKGFAPTTVCGDCGYILPCLNCGAPVVLHTKRSDLKNSRGPTSERIYICHACGTKRESDTVCGYCGSWKLLPLGIGVEKIAEEARSLFPGTEVLVLDKDHAPTEKRARAVVKRFRETGGILVGTELAFFHLDKVPYTALVSADALFSIPDFGVHEKIFYLVSHLREMTGKESVIQTRNIGKQVLAWASQGNIIDFYTGEIEERKALLYPPFSIFIKITSLSEKKAATEILAIKEHFLKWHPDRFRDSLILRIPKAEWPNADLSRELSLLGPQFSIKVDPESIL